MEEVSSSSPSAPAVPVINMEAEDVLMAVSKDNPKKAKQDNAKEDRNAAIDRAYIVDNFLKKDVSINDPNLKLINIVRNHPCLYDRRHEKYGDLVYKTGIWTEIATQLQKKRGEVKRKFTSLYQRFGTIYVMLRDGNLVKQGYPKKKFVYYEDMLFLKDQINAEAARRRIRAIVNGHKKAQKLKKKKEAEVTSFKSKKIKPLPYQRRPTEPEVFQRRHETRPFFNDMLGPSCSSRHLQTHSSFPEPLRQPMPLFPDHPINVSGYLHEPLPAMLDNRGNMNESFHEDDSPDDSNIDFFFKSVSQQVKKSNITDKSFMDLQFAILAAVSCKLSNYYK